MVHITILNGLEFVENEFAVFYPFVTMQLDVSRYITPFQ